MVWWCAGYSADEVHSIVSGKLALKYVGDEVDAMKEIAQASHKRSLAQFELVCNLAYYEGNLGYYTEVNYYGCQISVLMHFKSK